MAIDYGNILGTAGDIGSLLAEWEKSRTTGRAAAGNANQIQDRIALERSRLGLDQANAQNSYGLKSSDLQNQFGLDRSQQDLSRSTAQNNFGLGKVNAGIGVGNLDLAQKKFALDAPGARAGNAVRGDILSNAQDVSFSGLPKGINPPTISGGLRPSMFSGNTRALGSNMSAQALDAQQKGDQFAPLPVLPDFAAPSGGLPDYKAPPSYVTPTPLPTQTPLPTGSGLDSALTAGGLAGTLAKALAQSGAGSSSGGNIGQLAKDIWNHFHNNNFGNGGSEGTGMPSYDPFEADPNTGLAHDPQGLSGDPSGGTGTGPGMQNYYNSGGGSGTTDTSAGGLTPEEIDAILRQLEGGGEPGGGDQWTGYE